MKRKTCILNALLLLIICLVLSGCDSLRFAPSQVQKRNAWLHNKTAAMAAETAKNEHASDTLQKLASLSELQSNAFVAHYGLPQQIPFVKDAGDLLSESNYNLADNAAIDADKRPDAFAVADGVLELGIGVAALFGGAYGIRISQFLKQTRAKSDALKEIVQGNELLKQQGYDYASALKNAQAGQSPSTRQLVASLKTEASF